MDGFDNKKYIKLQSQEIKKRIELFNNKLYLEVGGKLVDDFHAQRVLPGYDLRAKIKIISELKDMAEVIFCISADDIENNKMNSNLGITYDLDVLRLIDILRSFNIQINSVVITLYNHQESAMKFAKKLENHHIKTYIHTFTKGYPTDLDLIVSEEGYGANPYITTTKPLVIVTAPGPGSGKLATCLSQLYHEYRNGVEAGYAKLETFPVWNLPLKHPVNMAYEAATSELNDRNMIDYFHLENYGITAVNYNRDLEVFPILKEILFRIMNKEIYKSPTDMGVNAIGDCILNDDLIRCSATKEIVRRYYTALCDLKMGKVNEEVPKRIKLLLNELSLVPEERKIVVKALKTSLLKHSPIIALEINSKTIITGKQTSLLTPASSLVLNCIKKLTGIRDNIDLLSPSVLKPILKLKKNHPTKQLNLTEVLIALSICSATSPIIKEALDNLKKLEKKEAHATYIVQNEDLKSLRNLGIYLTCEPNFYSDEIYEE